MDQEEDYDPRRRREDEQPTAPVPSRRSYLHLEINRFLDEQQLLDQQMVRGVAGNTRLTRKI